MHGWRARKSREQCEDDMPEYYKNHLWKAGIINAGNAAAEHAVDPHTRLYCSTDLSDLGRLSSFSWRRLCAL